VDLTVAIATYDGPRRECAALARTRAIPSAEALGVPVVHAHGDSLHEARNTALDLVATEWVVHLDADDELEAGYVDAMATGSADLRAPSVRYMRHSGSGSMPKIPKVAGHHHDCTADCLQWGNWLVVGTAVPADLVRKVGGWRDFPWAEDWDLWVRCWQAGATIEAIPQAVYRAHVHANSRNRAPTRQAKLEAHRAIARANGLPVP
jgi:GT2 family glycosyltransferase